MAGTTEGEWVGRFADEVIAEAETHRPGEPIICASGLSPSGPIHLGNLREVMTPHLVADEIRRRGHAVEHLVSWDDYDRFRKVPAGVDPSWEQHIGKPLTSVPAPHGSSHRNWAEHFKATIVDSLRELGVEFRGISQTQMYTSGAYRDLILLAMRKRETIDAILAQYRTKTVHVDAPDANPVVPAEGGHPDTGASAYGYYPYRPYCLQCGTDSTTVVAYDDNTTSLTYTCTCGFAETVLLSQFNRGKLVWKVDWPMRWAWERVCFEPSGVDHSSPGSSYVVGGQIVREVFDGWQPIGPMYAFVGIGGIAKMSSSRGSVPTPHDALQIMEPAVLRWIYTRRQPSQSIKIAFDQEIQRLYDEWDALERKVADGTAAPAELLTHRRSTETSHTVLPRTPRPVPYRTLASIVDITTGDEQQSLRILRDLDPEHPITSLTEVEPRLSKARNWVTTHVPADRRTHLRDEPDRTLLASLDDTQQRSLQLLIQGLDDHWSLESLTALVYGVPKLMLGLPMDSPPTPELKAVQRQYFGLLYRLLVGRDTGPRLPTLLVAAGASQICALLDAQLPLAQPNTKTTTTAVVSSPAST
jgi:lysyl-tRNA synthetase class 1